MYMSFKHFLQTCYIESLSLNEGMEEYSDKVNLYVSDRQFTIYTVVDKSIHILGSITYMMGSSFYEVGEVAANKGWGPLMYYTAMALLKKPLAPNQEPSHVSLAAKKIWDKMPWFVMKKEIPKATHSHGSLDNMYWLSPDIKSKYEMEAKNAITRHKQLTRNNKELAQKIEAASQEFLNTAMQRIY